MKDFTKEQAAAVQGEISRRMTFHTDEHGNPVYCDKHTRIIGGEEKPYPVQLIKSHTQRSDVLDIPKL